MQSRTLVAFMLLAGFSTTRAQQASVLLQDDFSDQKIGMFSTFVKAHTEYHYRPDAAPRGLWQVSTAEGETGLIHWICEDRCTICEAIKSVTINILQVVPAHQPSTIG